MIRGVPYDAEVEYIRGSGASWIDLGIKVPQDFWFEAHVVRNGTVSASAYYTILGCRKSSDVNDYQFSFNGVRLLARYGTKTLQYHAEIPDDVIVRVESGRRLYINGAYGKQLGYAEADTSLNLYAAALNSNGSATQILSDKLDFYYLKIGTSNGVLVRDMIPVGFTNELGQSEGAMYDRVTHRLFRNQGTGAFQWGPDVATLIMALHMFQKPPLD